MLSTSSVLFIGLHDSTPPRHFKSKRHILCIFHIFWPKKRRIKAIWGRRDIFVPTRVPRKSSPVSFNPHPSQENLLRAHSTHFPCVNDPKKTRAARANIAIVHRKWPGSACLRRFRTTPAPGFQNSALLLLRLPAQRARIFQIVNRKS